MFDGVELGKGRRRRPGKGQRCLTEKTERRGGTVGRRRPTEGAAMVHNPGHRTYMTLDELGDETNGNEYMGRSGGGTRTSTEDKRGNRPPAINLLRRRREN